jgi:trimeric autotransporter adhesin
MNLSGARLARPLLCLTQAVALVGLIPLRSGVSQSNLPEIHTVAGGGPASIPALSANTASPFGVALDVSGNTYVAAQSQNRVFKIDSAGNLSIAVGNGSGAYGGDGASAQAAALSGPTGLATDAAGNLYIADTLNNVIRVVNTSQSPLTVAKATVQPGSIATIAGTGFAGYDQDGVSASSAKLNRPSGLALDKSGNVYIADQGNQRIRRVDVSTGIISTVAGTGVAGYNQDGVAAVTAELNQPSGVAIDASGNLYIADQGNNRVRGVDASTGTISTVAGTGAAGYDQDGVAATTAELNQPAAVTVDTSSDLYIADQGNQRVRRVDASSGLISTVAGTGTAGYDQDGVNAGAAELNSPSGLAVDSYGDLYIADGGNNRLRLVNQQGTSATVAGVLIQPGTIATVAGNGTTGYGGDTLAATSSSLSHPSQIALDGAGNIYIADTDNSRIRVVNSSLTATITIAGVSIAPGAINTVAGTGSPGYNQDNIPAIDAELNHPGGIALDSAGNIYISDTDNSRVRVVNVSSTDTIAISGVSVAPGTIATVAGTGTQGYNEDGILAVDAQLNHPAGLSLDASGNIYIADSGNSRIRVVNAGSTSPLTIGSTNIPAASIGTLAGTGAAGYNQDAIAATGAQVNDPQALTLDNAGNLYFADTGNARVRVVNINSIALTVAGVSVAPGTIATVAGTGTPGYNQDGILATNAQLNVPSAVALDSFGNLYLADSQNQRIRQVNSVGVITTIAGTGVYGYIGDDIPATDALLAYPVDVKVDSVNNILIADHDNNRIRKVDAFASASAVHFAVSAPQSVAIKQSFSFTVTAVDSKNNPVSTYSGTVHFTSSDSSASLPIDSQLTNGTGTFQATMITPGSQTVSATDTIAPALNGSSAPIAVDYGPSFTGPNTFTATVGIGFSVTVGANGAPTPSFSASSLLPGGVTFTDNHDGTATLSGTPAVGTGSSYNLGLSAINSVGTVTETFILVIDEAPSFTSASGTTFTVHQAGSFSVTTLGFPIPSLSVTGTLPNGISLNGASLSGTANVASGGVYNAILLAATNSVGSASQSFTMTVDEAPSITSQASATFTVGSLGSFIVAARGYPIPTISESGSLPTGLTFNVATRTLSGIPAITTGGVYSIAFQASNGFGSSSQTFTLTVDESPSVASANNATFTVGQSESFPVTTFGYPVPSITLAGALPSGLSFTGSAFSGTPAPGTGGSYTSLTLSANNSIGSFNQPFTLTINQAPAITSTASGAFLVGQPGSFTLTATGYPVPILSESGTLPSGVTFNSATGVLSGTPTPSSGGNYSFTFSAASGVSGTTTQTFALTVNEAVLREGYDNFGTSSNLSESILTPANVSSGRFRKLFSAPVDGAIYAQPLYVPNLTINGRIHNVVYVATMKDLVYAFDADSGGTALWTADLTAGGGPVPSTDPNVTDYFGILGTPVIDLNTGTLFAVAYTTDASGEHYRLHALDLIAGNEKFGGPRLITESIAASGAGSVGGTLTFDASVHMQRPGLAFTNGSVIVSFGSFADMGNYHGWVMAYSAAQGLPQVGLYCVTPFTSEGAIWMSGRAPVIDAQGNIILITSNGGDNGSTELSESFVKFSPTLSVLDWFTASDFANRNALDLDLGSSGPIGIPGTTFVAGGGKTGPLFFLDSGNFGDNTTPLQVVTTPGSIFPGPAFWNNVLYIWPNKSALTAYHFNGSNFDLTPIAQSSEVAQTNSFPGAIAVSANGTSGGIVWAAMPSAPGGTDSGLNPNVLRAFDATTLVELWNSDIDDQHDDAGLWSKFRSPVVVNGKVYVGSITNLTQQVTASLNVYGLSNPGTSTASFLGTDTVSQGSWQPNYGNQGYAIADGTQSVPSGITLSVQTSNTPFVWAASTGDPRGVSLPTGGSVAAAWYSDGPVNVISTIGFADTAAHTVSLYMVDWDSMGRSQTIEVTDGQSGQVLDSETVSNFANGVYLSWQVTGPITIIALPTAGPNALINAIFLGGGASPSLSVASTHVGNFTQGQQNASYTLTVSNASTAGVTNGTVTVTDGLPSALSLVSMSGSGWNCPANSNSCSRTDPLRGASSYPSINVVVNVSSTAASPQINQVSVSGGGSAPASSMDSTVISVPVIVAGASFVSLDTKTAGSWIGAYGTDGYSLANLTPQSLPGYSAFSVQNQANYTWSSSTTDPRALQVPGNSAQRTAATWYTGASFTMDVNLTDGQQHQVAVYALDWDSKGRSEMLQVLDAGSGAVLNSQTISNFSGGAYVVWNLKGHVQIICKALQGPNAVLSGIFWGAGGVVAPPAESVTVNPSQTTSSAGGTVQFAATVANTSSQNVTWSMVSASPTGSPLGTFSSTTAGLYLAPATVTQAETVTVMATSADRTASNTATVSISASSGSGSGGTVATASYVGSDTTTQGNWQNSYGATGYDLASGQQSPAAGQLGYGSYSVHNQQNYTWAQTTSDPRALAVDSQDDRTAATWYSGTNFNFDVNFTDGNPHQVALYVIDWDGKGRSESVQVVDANNPGTTLDSRTIANSNTNTTSANFVNGTYLNWNISGHVTITISATGGPNAVVSGIFFGSSAPATPTAPTITSQNSTTFTVAQPGSFTVTSSGTPTPTLTESGGLPGGVTFTDNGNGTGMLSGTPAANTNSTYNIQLTATNSVSPTTQTFTLTVKPQQVVTGPTASFVSADTTTQGNWIGKYGSAGYDLANGPLSPASGELSYGSYSVGNQQNWTWSATSTDMRALAIDAQLDRTAATWFSGTNFSFDINFTDGNTHQVALYAIDWDSKGRQETVTIVNASAPSTTLDTRTIANTNTNTTSTNFVNGAYLIWNISGHVTITIGSNAGPNAVVSGIFFQ